MTGLAHKVRAEYLLLVAPVASAAIPFVEVKSLPTGMSLTRSDI